MQKKPSTDFLIFFEDHPLPSLICERNSGAIINVNRAAITILGYSRKALLRMTIADLTKDASAALRKKRSTISDATLKTKKTSVSAKLFIRNFLQRRKNYVLIVVDLTDALEEKTSKHITNLKQVSKVRANGNQVQNVNQEINPATKALELKYNQQNAIMKTMLSGISDGFFAVDKAGNFTIVNSLFSDVSGKASDVLLGKHIWKEFPRLVNTPLYEHYQQAVLHNQPQHFESAYKDRYYEVHAYPNQEGLFVYFRNITKRKRAEEEVRRKSQQVENIISSIQDFFVALDRNGTISLVNDSFSSLIQVPKEKLVGKNVWEVFPLMNGAMLQSKFKETMERGEKVSIEHRSHTDPERYYHVNFYPYQDGLFAIFDEITEKRRIDSEIRRLALVAEHTKNAVLFTDIAGKITWANRGFEKMTEFSTDTILGKRPADFLYGTETNRETAALIDSGLKEKRSVQVEIINYTKSGRPYWVDIEVIPVKNEEGNVTGFMLVESDITRLKVAVQEMLKSQEQLQTIMDYSPVDVFVKDLEGKFLFYNKSFEHHFVSEDNKITDTESYIDTIANEFTGKDTDVIQSEQPVVLEQEIMLNNIPEYFIAVKFPMLNAKNEIYAVGGVALKITERKRMEKKLLESEHRIRTLADNLPTGAIYQQEFSVVDEFLEYNYFSSGIESITGLTADAIVADPSRFTNLIDETDREGFMREIMVSKEEMKVLDYEFRIRSAKNDIKWIRVRSRPRTADNGNIIWEGFFIDLTDRKKVEEKLRQSVLEKEMLIKEIHHRVKNNLQLISSIIYLKMISLEQSDIRSFLDNTRNKIKSIALIHERLLQSEKLNQVEISDYLGKMILDIQISHYKPDLELRIEKNIEENLMPLDTAIYCGLIVNELVINAIKHAFQDRLVGLIEINMHREGKYNILKIIDNGISLPEDINPGKASSFGMQMLDVFVKQLNGSMKIFRENGTSFLVQF